MNLVIDIGGISSKIAIFENNIILEKIQIPYNKQINIFELVNLLDPIILKIINSNKINKICISSPGSINTLTGQNTGLAAILKINKLNLKEYFKNKYSIDTFIENDANCACIAEIELGNAINENNGATFVVGSGIGGSVFINKKIVYGKNMMAGEFGYQAYDTNNEKNLSEISGMFSLEKNYEKITKNKISGLEIYELYSIDEVATQLIDNQIKNLAIAVFNTCCVLNPDVILIGGGISQNKLFFSKLKTIVNEINAKYAPMLDIKIDICKFKNDANLYGANFLN